MGARIVQLYRTAIEGTSLPITMLKPILDEFHSTLVKNDEKKPTYPFSQSRFALIKLILVRNRKEEDFMPDYELADTHDAAYNLGRLLAVLEAYRNDPGGRKGRPERSTDQINAGIIERYYGQASTAPALMFPYLLSLSRHHLSKLKKGNEKDKNAARAIEQTIVTICKRFKPSPEETGEPPKFPSLLTSSIKADLPWVSTSRRHMTSIKQKNTRLPRARKDLISLMPMKYLRKTENLLNKGDKTNRKENISWVKSSRIVMTS